jgi:putative flippase GtrA
MNAETEATKTTGDDPDSSRAAADRPFDESSVASPWLSSLLRRWNEDDRIRFVVVGGFNTAFGYATFALLFLALQRWLHYVAVAFLAQAIAVAVAFFMQRTLVFRKSGSWGIDLLRFTVSVTGIFLMNLGLLSLFVELGGLPPLVAQAIVVVLTVVATYFAHRFFSFRKKG